MAYIVEPDQTAVWSGSAIFAMKMSPYFYSFSSKSVWSLNPGKDISPLMKGGCENKLILVIRLSKNFLQFLFVFYINISKIMILKQNSKMIYAVYFPLFICNVVFIC